MKKIIYIPTLHSALAPKGLPANLFFVCPYSNYKSKDQNSTHEPQNIPSNTFELQNMPFNGREAKTVLDEMLALGLSFSHDGCLKFMAAPSWLDNDQARKNTLRAENAELEEFTRTGATPKSFQQKAAEASEASAKLAKNNLSEHLCNAQKALLLAWEHEECIIAIRNLEKIVLGGQNSLQAALGEGLAEGLGEGLAEDLDEGSAGKQTKGLANELDETQGLTDELGMALGAGFAEKFSAGLDYSLAGELSNNSGNINTKFTPTPVQPEYSWRTILEAVAAFLPKDATLFTAFGPMIEDLQALDILQPLPKNLAGNSTSNSTGNSSENSTGNSAVNLPQNLTGNLSGHLSETLLEHLAAWPQNLLSSLLTARLPLWQMLGYAALPQNRPWLGTTLELLAAPKLES